MDREHELLTSAREFLPEMVALRRGIHAQPELGCENPHTKARVLEALQQLGLELWHSERTSGLVATLRGAAPGPTLLLRADTDALPMSEETALPYASRVAGAMHACGHDAHTAMLVGAAQLLHARRAAIRGVVKLMFQPGEEGFFGAKHMIDEGLLEHAPRVDAAFALHVAPLDPLGRVSMRPGPMLAANDEFYITLIGKGGHASMPHLSIDPVPAACELVLALQAMVTRRVSAHDPGVLTVARIEAGTTTNVIPQRATIAGTLRSFSRRTQAALREGVERVSRGVAAAHELEVEVRLDYGYPVVHNDPAFTAFARGVASELLGADRVPETRDPVMGAEDFSYVLERVPGAFAFLGMRDAQAPLAENLHSNRMRIDEDGMAIGAALHAAIALRFLDGRTAQLHTASAPRV